MQWKQHRQQHAHLLLCADQSHSYEDLSICQRFRSRELGGGTAARYRIASSPSDGGGSIPPLCCTYRISRGSRNGVSSRRGGSQESVLVGLSSAQMSLEVRLNDIVSLVSIESNEER